MRLIEYLNIFDREEMENANNKITSEVIPILRKNCAPFLREIKGANGFIFTGREKKINVFSKESTKINRKPRGTLKVGIRSKFNKMFKENFGFDRQENTVFCTGDISQADVYGQPYIFFPISKYKYFWSPKIDDLNVYFRYYNEEDEIDEIIDKIFKTYTNKNLKDAVQSKNEIIFQCNSYYLVEGMFRAKNGILGREFL